MSFSKTIQMYIFDGNPNGRIMCELSNWNGRVYKISRNELPDFSQRADSENTGVNFLFGKNEENNDTVYIGEAERIISGGLHLVLSKRKARQLSRAFAIRAVMYSPSTSRVISEILSINSSSISLPSLSLFNCSRTSVSRSYTAL